MRQVKETAIKMIQGLPDDITLKDIIYYLYVREQIEQGFQSLEAGEISTQEEVERKVAEWARSP